MPQVLLGAVKDMEINVMISLSREPLVWLNSWVRNIDHNITGHTLQWLWGGGAEEIEQRSKAEDW